MGKEMKLRSNNGRKKAAAPDSNNEIHQHGNEGERRRTEVTLKVSSVVVGVRGAAGPGAP